jgi:hypothetical protein
MNLLPCPISSATKAQVWFELRSSGLRVLAHGLILATLIYLLFALSIHYGPFRILTMIVVFGAAPAVLLLNGRNAFGIRRGQKRAYLSAFEATQPCGTAQMASVKLLVRAACTLVALAAICVSAWASAPLMDEWGPWISKKGTNVSTPLPQVRNELARQFGELTAYGHAAQVFTTVVFVLAVIAAFAAFSALRARYPRRLIITGSLLLLYLLALRIWSGGPHLIHTATPWILAAAMVILIANLLRGGFAERALTTTYLFGALAISVAYWAAFLSGISIDSVAGNFLLPFMIFVLAPWSLSRIRHT